MSYVDKVVLNGNEVDLGKPLYYHPIYATDNTTFRFQAVIINNDPTTFTWSTFKDYIIDLMANYGAIININGWYKSGTTYYSCYMIYRVGVDTYGFFYHSDDAESSVNLSTLSDASQFYDGVNKLN